MKAETKILNKYPCTIVVAVRSTCVMHLRATLWSILAGYFPHQSNVISPHLHVSYELGLYENHVTKSLRSLFIFYRIVSEVTWYFQLCHKKERHVMSLKVSKWASHDMLGGVTKEISRDIFKCVTGSITWRWRCLIYRNECQVDPELCQKECDLFKDFDVAKTFVILSCQQVAIYIISKITYSNNNTTTSTAPIASQSETRWYDIRQKANAVTLEVA